MGTGDAVGWGGGDVGSGDSDMFGIEPDPLPAHWFSCLIYSGGYLSSGVHSRSVRGDAVFSSSRRAAGLEVVLSLIVKDRSSPSFRLDSYVVPFKPQSVPFVRINCETLGCTSPIASPSAIGNQGYLLSANVSI